MARLRRANGWFDVDKAGLAQLVAGRSKFFVLRELIQNAWDEPGVTKCDVHLTPLKRNLVSLSVTDDAPEGFCDLSHAYTLFAPTRKRPNAEKRGRFNIGEKEVLALCKEGWVSTTKGVVRFEKGGRRIQSKALRTSGSEVNVRLSMTKKEVKEALELSRQLISPPQIKTTINGAELLQRTMLCGPIEASLLTEVLVGDILKKVQRNTAIEVYKCLDGETAKIYEMGIPVCETGDKWHYNVMQRVPLATDREKVDAKFLQSVRVAVLNILAYSIEDVDASEKWVRDASASKSIGKEVVRHVATLRWGESRAVRDPGDPRSVETAIVNGYHIVSGNELSKQEWENFRAAGAIPATSKLFPTKLVAGCIIPESKWTGGMYQVFTLTLEIAKNVGMPIPTVEFIESEATTAADYGSRILRFNVSRLGEDWFEPKNIEAQIALIVHELAHEYGGHLEKAYQDAICRFAAKLALNWRREE
jgi:hypothetical protein